MLGDEGLAGACLVGSPLLLPAPLASLDDHEAVTRDAVATTQLAQADLGSDVLALELREVVALVDDDRLSG
jgi:hypothetical protein